MLITPENYEKHIQRLSKLRQQIKALPGALNNAPFAIKNKLVKFNELNNALKEFDKKNR